MVEKHNIPTVCANITGGSECVQTSYSFMIQFCSQSYSDSFPSLSLFPLLSSFSSPFLINPFSILFPLYLAPSVTHPEEITGAVVHGWWQLLYSVIYVLPFLFPRPLPSFSLLVPLRFCLRHSCCHLLSIFTFTFCISVFMLPLRLSALISYSNEWVGTRSEYFILCRPNEQTVPDIIVPRYMKHYIFH